MSLMVRSVVSRQIDRYISVQDAKADKEQEVLKLHELEDALQAVCIAHFEYPCSGCLNHLFLRSIWKRQWVRCLQLEGEGERSKGEDLAKFKCFEQNCACPGAPC